MILALLLSCAVSKGPQPMPPVALLSRLSLDLRGRRPTQAEIEAVEDDPEEIDNLVEDFLRDPGFGQQIFARYADIYKTRAEEFIVGVDGEGRLLDPGERARLTHAIGDEPLRLLQRVVDDDRPWTDIVTVDWTMANDDLLAVMPLESLEDGDDWRMAAYTDERPGAGVLTTNGLWWRYTSSPENVNRGRAEAVARILMCDDRFDRRISFTSIASSVEEMRSLVQTDPACISCHVVIDPIGSYLFGFWRGHQESYSESLWYYPNRERYWEATTDVAPAFYGEPGSSLYDLGAQIAGDPRFADCAVKQSYGFLFVETPGTDDIERMNDFREAFIDGGATMRALFRALTADPYYRSNDPYVEGTVDVRRLTPAQMSSAVFALTGYRWTWEDLDMMDTDTWGVRVLSGGADGVIVTEASTQHSTSRQLAVERLAEAASSYAVEREADLARQDRTLFRVVEDLDASPDADELHEQIAGLVLLIHGRRVETDGDFVLALAALYDGLLADTASPRRAWVMLCSALFRHPDFLEY